jgi:hypothetical protein
MEGYQTGLPWHAGGLPSAAYAAPELAAAWAPPQMGQVSGIARGHNGSVWAFHRAGRVWGPQSFDASQERITDEQPIGEDVMLELDQDSGAPYHLSSTSCAVLAHASPFGGHCLGEA